LITDSRIDAEMLQEIRQMGVVVKVDR